jgi:hypothetical protein
MGISSGCCGGSQPSTGKTKQSLVLQHSQVPERSDQVVLNSDNDVFSNDNGNIRLTKVQKVFRLSNIFDGSEVIDGVLRFTFSKLKQEKKLSDLDISVLIDCYCKYRDQPEFHCIKCNYEVTRYNAGNVFVSDESELYFSKCRKRGNDVYVAWVNKKFSPLIDASDMPFFDPAYVGYRKRKSQTRLLYVTGSMNKHLANTLGYDRGWLHFGRLFNNFITNLRKKYGRVEFVRTWQSHETGYPHFHALLYFLDQSFNVVRWVKGNEISFRLPAHSGHRSYIKKAFKGGFIDICCCHSSRNALEDMLKYITRDIDGSGTKSDLTNTLIWYFRRQAWGLSRNFCECFGVTSDVASDETEQSEVSDVINDYISNYEKKTFRVLVSIEVLPIIDVFKHRHLLDIGEDPPCSFVASGAIFDSLLCSLRVDLNYFWEKKVVRNSKIGVPVYRWVLVRGD